MFKASNNSYYGDAALNQTILDALVFENKTMLELLEEMTMRADDVQQQLLEELLTRNAGVEYLQRHGLNGDTDRGSFKKAIPVVSYQDIKPDVLRMANGDTSNILSSKPIYNFLTSTGTTGDSKMIPLAEGDLDIRAQMLRMVIPVISQYIPGIEEGKGLYIFSSSDSFKTPGGATVSLLSTAYYNSSIFKNRTNIHYYNLTSPNETILCTDRFQSMYSQMLCGLFQNMQVLRVGAHYVIGLLRAIKFLENHWQLLVEDIRNGTLNSRITDQSVRQSVMKILRPDPKLAELIKTECEKPSWQGIIPRLWPNVKFVDAVATGSMSQYIPVMDYYTNGLPLFSMNYISSECCFGINLNPTCKLSEVAYTFIPSMAYFEFLPLIRNEGGAEHDSDKQELMDLVNVKLGQEYEPVVTTFSGLYRYRVGDVVKVTGFKNKAPQFKFICRKGVVLSVDLDQTDEAELQTAVNKAATHLASFGGDIVDHTSQTDSSTNPGHYVLFWEVAQKGSSPIPQSVLEDCCLMVEESFGRVYKFCRFKGSVGPLEVKIVEQGTFGKLMEQVTTINQYKTPRIMNSEARIGIVKSGVVGSFFSPKCSTYVSDYSTKSVDNM